MNILQVIPYFNPKLGGDVNVAYNISKHLIREGHNVTIITTDFEFDEDYANTIPEVNIVIFKCIVNIIFFLYSPGMKKWLKRDLRNFDIVHLHDFRSYQNIIVQKFACESKVPFIIHGHGSVAKVGKKWLKKLYDFFWGKRGLNSASGLIAVSKEEFNHFVKAGAEKNKIRLIYNGVDPTDFLKNDQKDYFRKKYGLKNKIILYLGRIHQTKGLDFLLEAFSNLDIKVKENSSLVLIGSDEGYKRNLIKLSKDLDIEKYIHFIGYVDKKEKISAYYDANVLVNPARYMAGVSLVTVESLLCYLPVITTTESGEIIQRLKAGFIVNYGDVNNLKEKISYSLEEQTEINEMTKRGRNFILENLTWDKVIQQNIELYQKVMREKTFT